MPKPYQVKKNLVGQLVVHYSCHHCGEGLKSSLSAAGTEEYCPSCNKVFLVPGTEELDKMSRATEAAQRERELAAVKREKEQQAIREREARERDELRAQVEKVQAQRERDEEAVAAQSRVRHTGPTPGHVSRPLRAAHLSSVIVGAQVVACIALSLALICGLITIVAFGTSEVQVVVSLAMYTVMLAMSSLLWFIIARALQSFDHLLNLGDCAVERLVAVERHMADMAERERHESAP